MKPELRVSVISDYICPFCYIGHKRLEKATASWLRLTEAMTTALNTTPEEV